MKLPKTPTRWLEVQVCVNCECVILYKDKDNFGVIRDFAFSPNYTRDIGNKVYCIHCGPGKLRNDVAAWYNIYTWFMPWTWNQGIFELQSVREQRLAAEKLFEPMRKASNE